MWQRSLVGFRCYALVLLPSIFTPEWASPRRAGLQLAQFTSAREDDLLRLLV